MVETIFKHKLAIGAGVLAAAAAGGGAYAATQSSTNPRQAFLGDVAKRLHISPAQLRSALQGAFLDQLQAAVAAGRMTQAQANAIRQRIERYGLQPGGPGLFGGPRLFARPRPFGGARLSAAASYLGLSETQLFQQLAAGKSLAQIAAARGKSTAGLKAALLAAARSKLDNAVSAKTITSVQERAILSRLSSRLDQLINRKGLAPGFHMRRMFRSGGARPWPGPGEAGPPPGAAGPPPGAVGPPPGAAGPPPGAAGPPPGPAVALPEQPGGPAD